MTGHIFIEGEIGTDVTPKTVRADIANYPQASDWIIHVNSGGGDVYDGYQIGSILKNLGKPTTAAIGAMCGSIATYAALCCDYVTMNPHGDFMIHLPTGTLSGTADDLRRGAAQLDRIKNELIDRYMTKVAKKGITREQLSAMIDKETSMSPGEAEGYGFVDEVCEKMKAVAKIDINKFHMENTLTKDEAKGFFDKILDKLDAAISGKKFKNSVPINLTDGTVITSDAATPDAIMGSNVTDASGAPVADGEYTTADGFQIVVAGGVVAEYNPATPADPASNNAEVEALKKQIADLTAQLGAKTNEAQKAVEATAKKEAEFKNSMTELKKEIEEIKSKTFGVQDPPEKAPEFKDNTKQEKQFDPMGELGEAFISSRPGGMW